MSNSYDKMRLTVVLRQRGVTQRSISGSNPNHHQFWLTKRTWTFEKVLYLGFPSGCGSGWTFNECPAERKADRRYVAFNCIHMAFEESRQNKIELLAGDGNIDELKKLFESGYTQSELDSALENAIAYSQIQMALYLLSLGADISSYGYNGVYYAVHNNELEGLKFAIANGVDINVNNGMLLNTGIETATNKKSINLIKWLLDNGANPKLLTDQSIKLISNYGTQELKNLIENAT